MKKAILLILLTVAYAIGIRGAGVASSGGDAGTVTEIGGTIHFRCARSELDPSYKSNGAVIDRLLTALRSSNRPDLRIEINGGASPEGEAEYNVGLSQRRALAVADYLHEHTGIPDSLINITWLGRDWDGLRTFVENDPYVPAREEVIQLTEALTESRGGNRKSETDGMIQLRAIGGGEAYSYLFPRYFAPLRATRISLATPQYANMAGMPLSFNQQTLQAATPDIVELPVSAQIERKKPFYMALKTNLLFDALLIPSLSAEFYLGKNISIVGNWEYGWWDKNHTHFYWRYYGGDVAVRWWFGKAAHAKPLTGHHLGIYGGIFTYDFEFGGKGIMGGRPGHSLWDRSVANVGVEYGYSLPLTRRLNMDFTLGVGYARGHYVKYHPSGAVYIWDSLNKLRWFGPTKAEISLTWLIGRGNYNNK